MQLVGTVTLESFLSDPMRAIHPPSVTPLKTSKFLLLGIAAGLIAIHLTITWQREYTDLWGMSVLFWFVVCSLVWKKRNTLSLETGVISSSLGTLIIAAVLIESTFPINKFPYVSPFISAVGLGLIASGFKGLKQYWQELLLLFFPGAAYVTLLFLMDLPALTAKFATFVLWYLGFKVYRQGVNINLPTGWVEVNQACSGLETILQLWVLAVLFLVMFPITGHKKILVPVVATFLGFVINAARVALMAILVASSNLKTFEYWHNGNGSLIFSMISVLIFGLFCLVLLRLDEPQKQDSIKS